jgi:L-fuculose-phosphate aldolase
LPSAGATCAEPYLPELILNFGRIPVTDFAMLSTDEVPRSILPFVHDYNGVLLANHGAVAWGADVWKAFDLMETIEHSAKVYKVVHDLGGGVELDPDQVSRLQGMHDFYRRRASARGDASEERRQVLGGKTTRWRQAWQVERRPSRS